MIRNRLNKVTNQEIEETKETVHLSIITRCPSKWLIFDLETLKAFSGTENSEIGKQWKFKFEINEELKVLVKKILEHKQ